MYHTIPRSPITTSISPSPSSSQSESAASSMSTRAAASSRTAEAYGGGAARAAPPPPPEAAEAALGRLSGRSTSRSTFESAAMTTRPRLRAARYVASVCACRSEVAVP